MLYCTTYIVNFTACKYMVQFTIQGTFNYKYSITQSLCVSTCMYRCVHLCIPVCVCMHLWCVPVCACVYACMCLCVCLCACLYVPVCAYVLLCVHLCVHTATQDTVRATLPPGRSCLRPLVLSSLIGAQSADCQPTVGRLSADTAWRSHNRNIRQRCNPCSYCFELKLFLCNFEEHVVATVYRNNTRRNGYTKVSQLYRSPDIYILQRYISLIRSLT